VDLNQSLKKIRMLVLDFDGTLTDGKVFVDQNGIESVCCSRKDSLGLDMVQGEGIRVTVISKEKNQVVKARCEKMGVEIWNGVDTGEGKLEILIRLTSSYGLTREEVLYIGDDINDLPCMKFAGIAATVADGHSECKKIAHVITENKGGNHAVREICDLLLSQ